MIQENKTAEGLGMPWEDIYGYAQAVKKRKYRLDFRSVGPQQEWGIGRRNGRTDETNLCQYQRIIVKI